MHFSTEVELMYLITFPQLRGALSASAASHRRWRTSDICGGISPRNNNQKEKNKMWPKKETCC